MQSDPKTLYKMTADRVGKSEQLYKDIGNFVFSKLHDNLRRPKKLIIKLKGVGTWYLRKRRMEFIIKSYPPNYDVKPEDPIELFRYENRKEIYSIFQDRLKDYEQYIKLRNEIRKVRYGTQKLLEPPHEEE
jgi:hypothetical protein